MNQLCKIDHLLVERFETRSGPIRRSDTNISLGDHDDPHMREIVNAGHHCAVLFTEAAPGMEMQARRLTPAQLMNARIPNRQKAGEFFQVVGGYYLEKKMDMSGNKPKVVSCKTSRLFGCVSGFPAYFGIKESGSVFLNEEFQLTQRKFHKKYLDELTRGIEGWTLIVNPAGDGRGEFPLSGEPIILYSCPEPPAVTVTETKKEGTSVSYQLGIQLSCGSPSSIEWDFGDGNKASGGTSVSHTYSDRLGQMNPIKGSVTVTVVDDGVEICKSVSELDIPPCPCIQDGDLHNKIASDNATAVDYDFTVVLTDPGSPEPTSYKWSIKEKGGAVIHTETTSSPDLSFKFPKKETLKEYEVHVTCEGPGSMCGFDTDNLIPIPANGCPVVNVSIEMEETGVEGTKVDAIATVISGPTPKQFKWDWGDGSPVLTTSTGEASHIYPLNYCEPNSYKITVSWESPEECSNGVYEEKVTIAGLKGSIEKVSWKAKEVSGNSEVTAEVTPSNGWKPAEFIWTWGDGSSPEKSKTPSHSHSFPIRYGCEDQKSDEYVGEVIAQGPGSCIDKKAMVIEVPRKCCPLFTEMVMTEEKLQDGRLKVICEVSVSGGEMPQRFAWDWDDGTDIEYTSGPRAEHIFEVPTAGEECQIHTVVCKGIGPDKCTPTASAVCTVCPPKCPVVTEVKIIAQKNISNDKVEVTFRASVSGGSGSPTKYKWFWGPGMVDYTKENTITKVLPRPRPGREVNCWVEVTSFGPGKCSSAKMLNIIIGTPVSHFWCRIIPYIVGFFLAMTLSSLLVCYVTDVMDKAPGETLPMVGMTFSAIGFILSLGWWLIYTAKRECKRSVCDWLAIGSAGVLGATITSFLLLPCELPVIFLILFLILLICLLFLYMRRDCIKKDGIKVILIFLALGLLAALLIFWFVADPVLECV